MSELKFQQFLLSRWFSCHYLTNNHTVIAGIALLAYLLRIRVIFAVYEFDSCETPNFKHYGTELLVYPAQDEISSVT